MIPDFKTYIGESVWADIHRRSNGSKERKEDSLDNMSLQGFYDYWHERYNVIGKTGGAWKDMECMNHPIKKEHIFSTPIEYTHNDGFAYTYCIEMSYDYRVEEIKELRITYFSSFILEYPNLKDVFGPEYNVDDSGYISIVNGEYKFHHYIDIIDKCVSMVKKPYVEIVMNESVWSDMHKRSNGIQVRKEDDVDNLDMEGFYDYLNDHYETLENTVIRKYDDIHAILVPIVSLELNVQRKSLIFIEIDFDPDDFTETKILMSLKAFSEIPYIDESLRKVFCVVDRDKTPERGKHVEIYPKDGGESTIVTNTFFLEVIDFILKEAEGKYTILLKKK